MLGMELYKAKKKKYGNVPTVVNGIRFDSKKEANYYWQLYLREKAGKVSDIVCHPVFPITIAERPVVIRSKGYPNGRKVTYSADFSFVDNATGKTRIVDIKGVFTQVSKLKIAIIEAIYGIRIEIV